MLLQGVVHPRLAGGELIHNMGLRFMPNLLPVVELVVGYARGGLVGVGTDILGPGRHRRLEFISFVDRCTPD